MQGTRIDEHPAKALASLVVNNLTSGNLARAAAKLHASFMADNPDATQDQFQAWASKPQENGLCRLINSLRKEEKRLMQVESAKLLEELGKVRGGGEKHEVWLPEAFPAKNPIPGLKEVYQPPTGPDCFTQVKSKNVMQNHPELFDQNRGDSFHIVITGSGVAPSGKLYAAPKAPPTHAPLQLITDEKQIYARLGGTTVLHKVREIYPTLPVSKGLKGKQYAQSMGSVGHHIRSTVDVMKTITRVTGKYDGVKSDLFCNGEKITMSFRNGMSVDFRQEGAKIRRCNLTIEWCDPIEGDIVVKGTGIDIIEGKVPIVTTVRNLNFDNIFGFAMVQQMGSPPGEDPDPARIKFSFGGEVPVRIPKTVWDSEHGPFWSADLHVVEEEGAHEGHHAYDGAVFHGAAGEQDLAKHFKTADLDRDTAKQLGVRFDPRGTKIQEFKLVPNGNGGVTYEFFRNRTHDSGGEKTRPNGLANILAMAKSPNVLETIQFLRDLDVHDRTTNLLSNLGEEISAGMSQAEWETTVDLVSAVVDSDLTEILQDAMSELEEKPKVVGNYPDRSLFDKYYGNE